MRQHVEKDGTIVTEGNGFVELNFTNTCSITQIVQDMVRIVRKMEASVVVLEKGGEREEPVE